MLNLIPLGSDFASSTFYYVGIVFSDLAVYIAILVGVVVGALILEVLVNVIRK